MKKLFLILLGLLIVSLIIMAKISIAEEQGNPNKTVLDEMTAVVKKMDELSKTQKEIIASLDEIKEELKIIKMRTALR